MINGLHILTLSLLFVSSSLLGQRMQQIGPDRYLVGINTEEFQHLAANTLNGGKQLRSNWCWAASIQMVLNYHGLPVAQGDLVKKIFGYAQPNQAANSQEILLALEGWQPTLEGQGQRVFAQRLSIDDRKIITALAYKWPLIVGLVDEQGAHAVVLAGVEYRVLPDRGIQIYQVHLLDPWPAVPTWRSISGQAFRQKAVDLIKIIVIR
ncbi:MAG TPA: papain-like cysteine protease family protein [Saprospiraceae bacterium]|nr:papain-like cysteine protease family protein [Saprospiraceae bacterium]